MTELRHAKKDKDVFFIRVYVWVSDSVSRRFEEETVVKR